ncbi:MAG: BTAD domain-containing putative transcriptional regulator [Acidimicrobiales bacterium]
MQFRVLGPLEVLTDDGLPVEVTGAKLRALLAMLVLHSGSVVRFDLLIDALWGEVPPQSANNALQVLVSKLRRILGADPADPLIVTQPTGYLLQVSDNDIDARRFLVAAAKGRGLLAAGDPAGASRQLSDALSLWRGPMELDLDLHRLGETYGVDLEETRLDALEDRIAADLALGHHEGLVAEVEPLTAAHPFRERFWMQLMTALYRCGRQAEALRAFQTARNKLADELGIDPGPELRQLEIDILNQSASLAAPESSRLPVGRTNLRPALTAYVGRDAQLALLQDLIGRQRLVTLVGPGGVGKTRLALELGQRALGALAPTVLMIELAAVTNDDLIATVAAAMATSGRTVDVLVSAIGESPLLLIFDNCEHLVATCADLIDALLRSCRGLRVIATTREVLGVPGEVVWPVPPLAIHDAVELFAQRAATAAPMAAVDDADPIVAEICRRLDGLPLALELAAARLRAFPLPQLLARLDDRFGLLTGGSRTAEARQQTLHALVGWSYDLLFESERRLFERLSLFSDGCSLDGAEAVCADEDIDRRDIADLLTRLVDKSFVTIDHAASVPRYRMLQTLVEFGQARLAERGEVAAIRQRHLDWVESVAAEMEVQLLGAGQIDALARLRTDAVAIRDAVGWATETDQIAAGLRISVHLAWHNFMISDFNQGYRWLRALLDALETAPDTHDVPVELIVRAKAWCGILGLADPAARRHAAEAIELARRGTDPFVRGEAALLCAFPLTAGSTQIAWCRELAVEARAGYHAAGHQWGLAHTTALDALIGLASGDLDQAARMFEQAVVGFRAVGDENTAVFAELRLSEVLERRGDLDDAAAVLEQGIAFATHTGIDANRARYLSQMSWLHSRRDDADTAMTIAEESLRMSTEPCNPVVRAHALFAHGAAARRTFRLDSAESNLLAAEQLHRHLGMMQWVALCLSELSSLAADRDDRERELTLAQAAVQAGRDGADPWTLAIALQRLAVARARQGSTGHAAELLELSRALRARHGLGASHAEQLEGTRLRAELAGSLGDPALENLRKRLETDDLEFVVEELTASS